MNMKTMRGFVDPFTLGFILAAIIATSGVATKNTQESEKQIQKVVQVEQGTTQKIQTATH